MSDIRCATQAELEAALERGARPILVGAGCFSVSGSAHVEAWGSAHVEARGSAHVVAWGSAHVMAWESAHVEAWGSAHVEAWGSAHVVASPLVAIHQHSDAARVVGGVVIRVERPRTAEQWCQLYGVSVLDGVATVYKALSDDYRSPHGLLYVPGTAPEAPDWDGGLEECGGGLHFSPSPLMAAEFHPLARRFVACPVALADIAVHPNAAMPQKVKARRVCGPIVEVDRYGKPV